MKATDLRLGNLVYNDSKIVEVDLKGLEKQVTFNSVGDSWYQPIILSEELLLRCGFGYETDYDQDNVFKYIDVENGFTAVEYVLEDKMLLIDMMCIKCESLHTLQNIWFAISSKELKIREK